MIDWVSLQSAEQVEEIVERSRISPCIIFKHSKNCGVSGLVQLRLEEDWDFSAQEVMAYQLDVIKHRDIARLIAQAFDVHHESPQLLLIRNGECTYDASHLEITFAELRECFHDHF